MKWEVLADAHDDHSAAACWLMLPGAYMKPADFVAAGFATAIHASGHRGGIESLDAGVDEVADGSALAALRERLSRESRPVRLCGISLGGHLSLALLATAGDSDLAASAATRVDRVCLLAPYLGPRSIAGDVGAAGGIAAWAATTGAAGDDIDFAIWRWLAAPTPGVRVDLGYGADDRFARAHALVARTLPPDRVTIVPGGHDWGVWSALWSRHLENAPP